MRGHRPVVQRQGLFRPHGRRAAARRAEQALEFGSARFVVGPAQQIDRVAGFLDFARDRFRTSEIAAATE
jgi:hypothetical protein